MPSEKQYLERRENICAILQYLRSSGAQSRRQIADALGLSWGCVSELVSLLLLQKILLEEEAHGGKARGRAPTSLKLNSDILFLGVDININGLNGCVCDLLGQKVAVYTDALQYGSKEELLQCLWRFVEDIIGKHKGLAGIGFAMQGILDRNSHLWEFSSKAPIRIDFEKDIQLRLDIPALIEHDPNCILYGCLDDTQARKMILRLDKGIGAAVYTGNGFLKDGLLEVAYLVVNEQGQRLRDVVCLDEIETICETAPESAAQQLFAQVGQYLGVTLGNLCNLLSLDEILICGEMVAYFDRFSPALMEHYRKTVLPVQQAKITPVPVTDAAYGAAKMAMDRFQY